jgi:hypothetical protein
MKLIEGQSTLLQVRYIRKGPDIMWISSFIGQNKFLKI